MDSQSININKANYYDQTSLTLEVCASMMRHRDVLSAGEFEIVSNLVHSLETMINMYSCLGLPYERTYWKELQKKMKETLLCEKK